MVIKVRSENGDELEFSPLSERVICGYRLEPFAAPLWRLRQRHQLRLRIYGSGTKSVLRRLLWLAAILTAVVVFRIIQRGRSSRRPSPRRLDRCRGRAGLLARLP
jgi:hypothetical protein